MEVTWICSVGTRSSGTRCHTEGCLVKDFISWHVHVNVVCFMCVQRVRVWWHSVDNQVNGFKTFYSDCIRVWFSVNLHVNSDDATPGELPYKLFKIESRSFPYTFTLWERTNFKSFRVKNFHGCVKRSWRIPPMKRRVFASYSGKVNATNRRSSCLAFTKVVWVELFKLTKDENGADQKLLQT